MTRPNVLVIFLDSVRAASTSLYGHSRRTTPFLESLANESTVYEHAYAPSTTSISSHLSAFTGLHEHEHQIYDHTHTLDEGLSIWEYLSDEYNYSTGAFTSNPFFSGPYGLCRGFDTVVTDELPYPEAQNPGQFITDPESMVPDLGQRVLRCLNGDSPIKALINGISQFSSSTTSEYFIGSFLDWLETTDGSWAAFLNLMDAHTPYVPSSEHNLWADEELIELMKKIGGGAHNDAVEHIREYGSWWRQSAGLHLYEGAIHEADAYVQELIVELKERGEFENTLLIISADHGEAFGEPSRIFPKHHLICHGVGVHECQTHVPLLVSPSQQSQNATISKPASLTYLPKVIESAVNGKFDPAQFTGDLKEGRPIIVSRGFQGESRYSLRDTSNNGEPEKLPDRVYAYYESDSQSIVKYCQGGNRTAKIRIYSPQEAAKVANDDEGKVESVFDDLQLHESMRKETNVELNEKAQKRLKQFGYLE